MTSLEIKRKIERLEEFRRIFLIKNLTNNDLKKLMDSLKKNIKE